MKESTSGHSTDLVVKLTRYSALAGAAGLGGSVAQAGITVWTPSSPGNSITPPSLGSATLYFDFEFGTVQQTSFTRADFKLIASNSSTTSYSTTSSSISANYFYAGRLAANLVQQTGGGARLSSGNPISAGQTFGLTSTMASGTNGGSVSGNWSAGGQGFLGLRFAIGGNPYFGWADVTIENVDPSTGLPKITLNRFAYNATSGQGLSAGQTVIPEPESILPMALLTLGAAGLTRYRRRQAAAGDLDR